MKDTPHEFVNGKCINCHRTIEGMFFELVERGNPDACEYCFQFSTGSCYSELHAAHIVKKNSRCLSEDELNIKNIIE